MFHGAQLKEFSTSLRPSSAFTSSPKVCLLILTRTGTHLNQNRNSSEQEPNRLLKFCSGSWLPVGLYHSCVPCIHGLFPLVESQLLAAGE